MLIYLVRHGHVSLPSEFQRTQITPPSTPLSRKGMGQAQRAAMMLSEHSGRATVISSDTLRTKQTGIILSQTLEVPITMNPVFGEVDDEKTWSDSVFMHGWQQNTWSVSSNYLVRNSVEQYKNYLEKWVNAISDCSIPDEHVLIVVSHQLPLELVLRSATSKNLYHHPRERIFHHAAVRPIIFDNHRFYEC